MEFILEGLFGAINLIISLNPEVREAVLVSLKVSGLAVIFASLVGIPLGLLVGTRRFFGRQLVVTLFNTCMGLPSVGVGLLVYAFVSRQGPLGSLNLLFTVPAMVIGEFLLVTPVVAALTLSAVAGADARIVADARALGASPFQASLMLLKEVRLT